MQAQAEDIMHRPRSGLIHRAYRVLCRVSLLALGLLCLTALPAAAEPPKTILRLALPEGLSPRTIGYYLARENGYFAEAGLDVRFETPTAGVLSGAKDPTSVLSDGDADLAIEAMPIALKRREAGGRIVHVAQFFQKSSMELVCRAFVDKPQAVKGHAIGVWFGGYESSFFAWMSQLNLSIFGGAEGVTVLRQDRDLSDFQRFQVDCSTTATYLAPLQFAAAGLKLSGMKAYSYQSLGLGTLEDGLYANETEFSDPNKIKAFAAFLGATNRGWQILHDNRAGAVKLLQADPAYKSVDAAILRSALDEVDAVVTVKGLQTGRLDPADYDRTVNLLLTGAPNPVLRRAPTGATSDIVWINTRQG